jgi:hypothetical protein
MKPKVVLTFDLDGWRTFYSSSHLEKDNLLELGIPRIIHFLEQNNLDATFFMVGQNVRDFPCLHSRLKKYELGNHSLSHPKALTKLTHKKKSNEVISAHKIIADIFGKAPQVFRAPHYQIDRDIISLLQDMGYYADSSLLKVVYPINYALNYFKHRGLRHDPFELPLSSFLIPFNGTAAINYGMNLTKAIFGYLMRQKKPIVLNFHAKDFVNVKLPRKRLMNRPCSLGVTEAFLQLIVEKCEIMSIREYYGKRDQEEN